MKKELIEIIQDKLKFYISNYDMLYNEMVNTIRHKGKNYVDEMKTISKHMSLVSSKILALKDIINEYNK